MYEGPKELEEHFRNMYGEKAWFQFPDPKIEGDVKYGYVFTLENKDKFHALSESEQDNRVNWGEPKDIGFTVKELVKGTLCYFSHYKAGFLYYTVTLPNNEDKAFRFPIPIEDTDQSTFQDTMRSMTLMRWIRKSLKEHTIVDVTDEYFG